MPFYEYQCAACGHHHEELQKVADRPLRKCPVCSRTTLKRLVSAPVFRLKGGGWYETDFKHEKEEKRNLAGEKEPAAAEVPAAEKAKDSKSDAVASDATPKSGADTKPAASETKARPPPVKTPPSRKAATRRRARK
ncbi:MAG: FmdB family zinc ribbon protein [Steroidobacteraceae bacterium]